MEQENKSRDYRVFIEVFGAIGIALGALITGYTISNGQWDATISRLEAENKSLQKTVDQERARISSLKVELAQNVSAEGGANPETTKSVGRLENDKQEAEDSRFAEVNISQGDSASLFGGDLYVSVVATDYGGDPLRHTVFGRIGAPGRESKDFANEEPGYSTSYNGYEVRILSAGTLSAKFLVQKLDET